MNNSINQSQPAPSKEPKGLPADNSVPAASDELRNPQLFNHCTWELKRFGQSRSGRTITAPTTARVSAREGHRRCSTVSRARCDGRVIAKPLPDESSEGLGDVIGRALDGFDPSVCGAVAPVGCPTSPSPVRH